MQPSSRGATLPGGGSLTDAAEAFATAVERWPADGVPPNPGAWLTTTANHKAIDRIRRESKRNDKHREAMMPSDGDPPEPLGAIDDDRLRLIFTCCHPALAIEARVALTQLKGTGMVDRGIRSDREVAAA